jgi:DNA-binding CsgD family transcriptional regulator
VVLPGVPALHLIAAAALAFASPAGASYGWPLKPFDRQHPVRSFFDDPRRPLTRHGRHADRDDQGRFRTRAPRRGPRRALRQSASPRRGRVERFAGTPAPVDGRALEQLTDREREILRLLASGLSNSELASRLYLSETTVKTRASAVLRKLGVRDRVQAVIAAYEAGLVKPGAS